MDLLIKAMSEKFNLIFEVATKWVNERSMFDAAFTRLLTGFHAKGQKNKVYVTQGKLILV